MLLSLFYLFSGKIGLLPLLAISGLAALCARPLLYIRLESIFSVDTVWQTALVTGYVCDVLVGTGIGVAAIRFALVYVPSLPRRIWTNLLTDPATKMFLQPFIVEQKYGHEE